jgi:hypothetical protein
LFLTRNHFFLFKAEQIRLPNLFVLGHLSQRLQAVHVYREKARKLTSHEWGEVALLSLYLSQRLLNDYIKAGIEVSNTVIEQLCTRHLGCWRQHWPLGQHTDRVRFFVVDTCWLIPG